MSKRVEVAKHNQVLANMEIEYVSVKSLKPNSYNPNRQSPHDFELLCKSIAADGFTQPVIANRLTGEIVDGEHRWRACSALGFEEIPVVFVEMSAEQMRIATLRHNRARGSEDGDLAADVLRELAQLGALGEAQSELMLDPLEVKRLMEDLGRVEAMDEVVPDSMLGPDGQGVTAFDQGKNIDQTADRLRAQERILAEKKGAEEYAMVGEDRKAYRLVLFFTDEEAVKVRQVLEGPEGPAARLLALCREEYELMEQEERVA